MKIVVASTNPVKISSTGIAFAYVFPSQLQEVIGCKVDSEVSVQPKGKDETFKGACNRMINARQMHPSADYWVGIEGGVEDMGSTMFEIAYVAVLSRALMKHSWSCTSPFFIPSAVAERIRAGEEHGPAADAVFGTENSKQINGTVGIISNNLMTRTELYVPALKCALFRFLKPELYE